jgi:protein-tyrosine-phosphatase
MNTPDAPARPQSVLFACTQNAIRSPMAEALARHFFGRDIYFASAGVRPGKLDPFAVAVMDELGMDISKHKPHSFADLEDSNFDLIVSLSPEAHHTALDLTRTMAADVVYWPTLDPSAAHGSRGQMLDAYRAVRDGLSRRIKERLEWRPIASV